VRERLTSDLAVLGSALVDLCLSCFGFFFLSLSSVFISLSPTLCSSVPLGLYRARRVDNGR
jgi:hypothetical protein